MPEQQPRLRASDVDRDDVIRILQEAHASGRLDLSEFEERQEQALSAKFMDEFAPLLADLPEGAGFDAVPARHDPSAPMITGPDRRRVVATRDESPAFSLAIMSGKTIRLAPGDPGVHDFSFWAGHDIYLADALGPGNVVVMDCSAIMAGHEIFIPPGVRVIDESIGIMGGNDVDANASGDGANGTLILRGFLFWGGHDVKLDPNTIRPY